MTDTSTRWQRRKDARPQEIIDAALTLFTQRGFAATKLDEVAKLAGVTKGTVYLYFDSKEELFFSAIREMVVPMLELGESRVASFEGSATELLKALTHSWVEKLLERKGVCLTKVMLSDGNQYPEIAAFYHQEVVLRGRRLFASVLDKGVASGEFRPMDTMLAARNLIAPILLYHIWLHSFAAFESSDMTPRDYVDFHLNLQLNGLRAHPERN